MNDDIKITLSAGQIAAALASICGCSLRDIDINLEAEATITTTLAAGGKFMRALAKVERVEGPLDKEAGQ